MSSAKILMYGADWCGDCIRTKRQLAELQIDFDYIDIEADDASREKAIEISGAMSIPVVVFPDGTHLVEPSNPAMFEKLKQLGLIVAH